MNKSSEPPSRHFTIPDPPTASASEGVQWAQDLARRYLCDDVRLAAGIAFGDGPASSWTRLQAARLIAQIAGAIPETIPEASQVGGDGGAHA